MLLPTVCAGAAGEPSPAHRSRACGERALGVRHRVSADHKVPGQQRRHLPRGCAARPRTPTSSKTPRMDRVQQQNNHRYTITFSDGACTGRSSPCKLAVSFGTSNTCSAKTYLFRSHGVSPSEKPRHYMPGRSRMRPRPLPCTLARPSSRVQLLPGHLRMRLRATGEEFGLVPPNSTVHNVIINSKDPYSGRTGCQGGRACACARRARSSAWCRPTARRTTLSSAAPGWTATATSPCSMRRPAPKPRSTSRPAAGSAPGAMRCRRCPALCSTFLHKQ